MADKDESQKPPSPPNRKADPKRIKVRVVGQPIRHEGKTYHGPSKKGEVERAAETFMATEEQIANYGEKFVAPVEA
jgi:hypothetical protein